MTRAREGDRRGATLVLVLWLLLLTGGLAAGVTTATRSATSAAGGQAARVHARYAAESGVEAAVVTLTGALQTSEANPVARRAMVSRLDETVRATLGDSIAVGAHWARVAVVDASARLDLNLADSASLVRLLAQAGSVDAAVRTVRALREAIRGDGRVARPLTSLDDATAIPGVDIALLERVASDLTVDGDGQVNVSTASPAVLAAASGGRVVEPTRILLIARGWTVGHPATVEIQAVYALEGTRLTLVRWREQER